MQYGTLTLPFMISCFLQFCLNTLSSGRTGYYADAEQSALEIRTSFFLFFFSSWLSQIVTQVVIGYTYIVANGSSCCFFLTGLKVGFVIVEGFMR